MAIEASSFPSQQAENPSSDLDSCAEVQPNPQLVLPIANVDRAMRSVLPRDVQLEEDSKALMAKFASIFMSHIFQEANRQCQLENRRIVTIDDLIAALRRLGFERHDEVIATYLARVREASGNQELVDVPMAPTTPPHAAAHRAPMVGDFSRDEGSDGYESDGETSNGIFDHGENLNRRSNLSG